jgi:hypothetical protein
MPCKAAHKPAMRLSEDVVWSWTPRAAVAAAPLVGPAVHNARGPQAPGARATANPQRPSGRVEDAAGQHSLGKLDEHEVRRRGQPRGEKVRPR